MSARKCSLPSPLTPYSLSRTALAFPPVNSPARNWPFTPERLNGQAQRRATSAGRAPSRNQEPPIPATATRPAADMAWSEDAIRDSFLLSNAVPQNAALNSGKWRVIETAVRKVAAGADFVLVFTGPRFRSDDARIGANQAAAWMPRQRQQAVLFEAECVVQEGRRV
ncbi:MAG: DNA/RNA non-specific endonuclease [Bryobacteraceae bacterium]